MSWQQKAQTIIAKLSMDAYRQANTRKNGKPYKRHRAYSLPQVAHDLVDCLNTNDEHRAKSIMMWDYDVRRVTE